MGGLRSFRSWRREDDWSGQWGTPMVACGAVPLRDRGVSANQVPCASMPMLSSLCPPLSLSLSLALSAFISIFSFRDLRISECQIQIHSQPPMLHCQLTMDSWGGCRPPPINLQLRAMTFETEGRDMNISKGKSNPSNATSPAFT